MYRFCAPFVALVGRRNVNPGRLDRGLVVRSDASQAHQVDSAARAHQAQSSRVDVIFVGMCLDEDDRLLQVIGHLDHAVRRDRARTNDEQRVTATTEGVGDADVLLLVELSDTRSSRRRWPPR